MVDVKERNRTDEEVSDSRMNRELGGESQMKDAKKTMYTVTDGGRSSNAEISDGSPNKGKMSRS